MVNAKRIAKMRIVHNGIFAEGSRRSQKKRKVSVVGRLCRSAMMSAEKGCKLGDELERSRAVRKTENKPAGVFCGVWLKELCVAMMKLERDSELPLVQSRSLTSLQTYVV